MNNAQEDPDYWLPDLTTFNDSEGKWADYVEVIYELFKNDFIDSQPQFDGKWVRCRKDPIYDGKFAGFWHSISDGKDEEERIPDFRRCERISWIRPIIENAISRDDTDVWKNQRGSNTNVLIWYDEYLLVVLGERTRRRDGFQYLQLITAYTTEKEHRKRKLRRERDEYEP